MKNELSDAEVDMIVAYIKFRGDLAVENEFSDAEMGRIAAYVKFKNACKNAVALYKIDKAVAREKREANIKRAWDDYVRDVSEGEIGEDILPREEL